ncbi:pro-adrenomedullin [Pogona vitticeps]
MKVLSLALLYLGSVSFLGVEAAKLDLASDFKRKWTQWEQRRARRDLAFAAATLTAAGAADASLLSLIRTQDVKGEPGMSQPSSPEERHIRVKRYRQNTNTFSLRLGCRLGTCNTQNLAHMIYHLTDKDKDSTPPANKLSAHGYGRRRRRSLADGRAPVVSGGSGSGDARTLSRLLRSLKAAADSSSVPAQPRRVRSSAPFASQ